MLYAYEFRSYGPDGIAVIYQRNRTTGLMEKRFPIQDYQASVVAVAGPAIPAPSTTAYTAFGTPTPDGTENSKGGSTWLAQNRTAYMDKCIDWETAPYAGMEEFRLYDVSARKLQPATGTFLTPDPLWTANVSVGSYTYCSHDPVNYSDPSGLIGLTEGTAPVTPTVEVWATRIYPEQGYWGLNRDQYEMLYFWGGKRTVGGDNAFPVNQGYGGPSGGRGGGKGNYVEIKSRNTGSNGGQGQEIPKRTIESPDVATILAQVAKDGVGTTIAKAVWNSPVARDIVPDILTVGAGFTTIVVAGTGVSVEFNWVLRGPEASILPILTTTVDVGGGASMDATLNLGGYSYLGDVNDINSGMLYSEPNAGNVTYWGSLGVAAGGKAGITGSWAQTKSGWGLVGRHVNLGVGMPALIPVNAAGGVSSTFLLYNFNKP